MTSVEQIKERLSILEVVGSYVELTKAGKHHKGKSPFTSEKTPSFFVSPDRGMYYCFSSQKGGDMFTFIEEMEGVDFKGALKILAEKAGVELVPEDPKKRDARDTQYTLLEEATEYFFKMREKNKHVTEYIEKRGVSGATWHAWRIGYAPDEWRALRDHLVGKKFTEEQILHAGLIKSADGGKEPYDVFRDRVMFPIADSSGRIVAFSGRTLKQEEGVPKYVNSPETELFQKSEILYGYDKAKQGIRSFDFSLIVEGQFDVVLAHQAGYSNAVAVSGTALTPHHAMLLERLSERVVLALDADRAGIAAVKRSAEIMLKRGMDVKVARMPEGKDPADIIKDDPIKFKKIIGTSVHVIDFLLEVLKGKAADERTYKLIAREEIVPLLLSIPNMIDRDHFIGVVAKIVGTTHEAIGYEVERLSTENDAVDGQSVLVQKNKTNIKHSRKDGLIRNLYVIMLVAGSNMQMISDQIGAHLKKFISESEFEKLADLPSSEMSEVTFLVEQQIDNISSHELAHDVSHKLTELSHIIAKDQLSQLRAKLVEAEKTNDNDLLTESLNATKEAELLLQNVIKVN